MQFDSNDEIEATNEMFHNGSVKRVPTTECEGELKKGWRMGEYGGGLGEGA